MSKSKKLDRNKKEAYKKVAEEAVNNREKYFNNPSDELSEFLDKHPKDAEVAIYKILKKAALKKENSVEEESSVEERSRDLDVNNAEIVEHENSQEDDGGLHLLEKLKHVGKVILGVLHKAISPFVPELMDAASAKIEQQIEETMLPDVVQGGLSIVTEEGLNMAEEAITNMNIGDGSSAAVDDVKDEVNPLGADGE